MMFVEFVKIPRVVPTSAWIASAKCLLPSGRLRVACVEAGLSRLLLSQSCMSLRCCVCPYLCCTLIHCTPCATTTKFTKTPGPSSHVRRGAIHGGRSWVPRTSGPNTTQFHVTPGRNVWVCGPRLCLRPEQQVENIMRQSLPQKEVCQFTGHWVGKQHM